MEGADVLTDQLQSGQIDQPTMLSEVKNSGAMDVTLEEGDEGDDNKVEVEDESSQDTEQRNNNTRRHQGTQTEQCSIPVADFVVRELMSESHECSL